MTRFSLPNLTFLSALVVSGALLGAPAHALEKTSKMRVDCRFFSSTSHFCYSSAIYSVSSRGDINDIRFGTGCDYETIYDDGGTTGPQDEVSDAIRPKTAALPRIEITPKGSLRHPGTYTSKLESEHGRMTDGTCYVREISDEDGDYHTLMQNWFYFQ